MTAYVAFLRGVNLGKRQMQMAELKACLEAAGYTDVKTILASGNVRFTAASGTDLKPKLDTLLSVKFDFNVEIVLRSVDALRAIIASAPFAAVPEDADVKLYTAFIDPPFATPPVLTGIKGDYDIARVDPAEVHLVAHRLSNGRYGEGLDKFERQLPKTGLVTTRNWNTVQKSVA